MLTCTLCHKRRVTFPTPASNFRGSADLPDPAFRRPCVTYFIMQPQATALAAPCGDPQANRNDFYFYRNAGRSPGGERDLSEPFYGQSCECDYVQPMAAALRIGAVRCIKTGLSKNLRFGGKVFKFFGFSGFQGFFRFQCRPQIRPDTKIRPRKNILYTTLSVISSFLVNYNETHKSRKSNMICIKFDQK